MPRKRMIDPEFWNDEEIGAWSVEARLFYIGLWNFADDEGRLRAHPKLLKSEIFPYDEKTNIDRLKSEVSKKVFWYVIDGQEYGFIKNFLKHQRIDRPGKSQIPTPNKEELERFLKNPRRLGEDSSKPRRRLAPKLKEVKLREEKGKEENTPCPASGRPDEPFDPESPPSPSGLDPAADPVDVRLTQLLVDLMLLNNPKSSIIKRLTPARQAEWFKQCRLLREADGKTPEEIERVIAFSQTDSFWKSNILSMPKLREQWDQLWLKAQRGDPMSGVREWLAQKEKEREEAARAV